MNSLHSSTEFEALVKASNDVLEAKRAADSMKAKWEALSAQQEAACAEYNRLQRKYFELREALANLAARVPAELEE